MLRNGVDQRIPGLRCLQEQTTDTRSKRHEASCLHEHKDDAKPNGCEPAKDIDAEPWMASTPSKACHQFRFIVWFSLCVFSGKLFHKYRLRPAKTYILRGTPRTCAIKTRAATDN